MIITKLLTLNGTLTKSKAITIILLLLEIAVLLYAVKEAEAEENNTIDLEDHK